ncbi:hypothetical protein ASC97_26580 [Rhizobium sp. Root1203]|uniref:DUF6522 family protein n=1 Tax=Rhizobium sp. Root1203 TaxID=1736427 RepID=UPI00070EE9B4|nr:DUF6522 family protein [Rhizobium sp. Root1203]KQV23581.1 hypothetical protein ASC97_26580 [Rhizobium sp. Root1203]
MKIDLAAPTVDASHLAARFGLEAETLRKYITQGLVRSRVEVGENEDLGRSRLTVRFGNRVWIAIVGADGSVLSEETKFVASSTSRQAVCSTGAE